MSAPDSAEHILPGEQIFHACALCFLFDLGLRPSLFVAPECVMLDLAKRFQTSSASRSISQEEVGSVLDRPIDTG
jgi:hypothetical protein